MNWQLFYFTVAVGTSAGLLFRRGMTHAQAISLVCGRVVLGLVLATALPDVWSASAYIVLGMSEFAHLIESAVSHLWDGALVRNEVKRWQQPPQSQATRLETQQKRRSAR